MKADDRPRVRAVEVLPVGEKGERIYLLRDSMGYAEATVGLSEPAVFLVSLCDGMRTLRDIQAEYVRRYGEILTIETLTDLLTRLDEEGFMEGERFRSRLAEVRASFAASAVRPPAHAGVSYPEEPSALRHLVHGWLDDARSSRRISPEARNDRASTRAIIAPHIDLRVGGPSTARAYAALEANASVEVVFVLGTAHASPDTPFVLTRKPYETPLGTVPTDTGLVEELARRLPFDPFAEEMVHRREHSIEFQSVFLAALAERRASGPALRAVPILCGSVHAAIESGKLPEEDSAALAESVEALKDAIRAVGRSAAVVAGADLSHVGLRFGDSEGAEPALWEAAESLDRSALRRAAEGDAEGFYRTIAAAGDRYRCCGITPIYTLLRIASVKSGHLLAYEQTTDETGTVSFASMAFD